MTDGRVVRLEDLYKRGAKGSFSDGENKVEVYLKKPNPLELDNIQRRAAAKKALYLIGTDDPNSEEYLATYMGVRDYDDRDGLITIITGPEVARARRRAEAEVLAEERWSENDYLEGLRILWEGDAENRGLKYRYAEEPDDVEAKRVLSEMTEYQLEVNARVEAEKIALRDAWTDVDDETLWRRATELMVKRKADEAYSREWQQQQIFYAVHQLVTTVDEETREETHSAGPRYFPDLDAVRLLDPVVHLELVLAIEMVEVPPLEGKDLPATPDSSASSETPEMAEASLSSGPADADL